MRGDRTRAVGSPGDVCARPGRIALRPALLAAIVLLPSCGGGGGGSATTLSGDPVPVPTPSSSPTPTASPTPAFAPKTPTFLGLNVTPASYYGGEQVYVNLLVGSSWQQPGAGWAEIDPRYLDRSGNIAVLPEGGATKVLTPPVAVLTGAGARVRCTWTGTGQVALRGIKSNDAVGDHSWEFDWSSARPGDLVYLELSASSGSDPVRSLDCREKGATGTLFSAEFLSSLRPYGVLRFMDWSAVNVNAQISWANRTLPEDLAQSTQKGAALEHMVALANQVEADPWVNVPWNADADYVRRMAQLIHDGIPAQRHVYVEVSNEVWNPAFVVMHQAEREGLAEGLSNNGYEAALRRYAEKTTEVMKVWTQVFADRPGQLVRVAVSQGANPWTAQTVLGYADTANWVDALSIAPYFGYDLFDGPLANVGDLATLFPALTALMNQTLSGSVTLNQAVARQYGKRLIAYEAGQHLLSPGNVDRLAQINRDPRMYDLYRSYIAGWKTQVNDTMVLYSSTGPITQYGAWGLREYAGQPLAQTPKRRAALDTINGN